MPENNLDRASLSEDLQLILEAASEGGRIALGHFGKDPEVWMKEGQSPVSEADLEVDRYLRDFLSKARPDYGWLSEEMVDEPGPLGSGRSFIVDPIDGTRGFLQGNSAWCVSIGIVEQGRPIVGVLDCPARGEVFTAIDGQGAFLNGEVLKTVNPDAQMRVGGPRDMVDALNSLDQHQRPSLEYIPSLAYRVAMVARGDIDATFVKPNSHDWDLVAADLILKEAGGAIINDLGKAPLYARESSRHGALAAGRGDLLKRMQQVIASSK